MTKKLVLIIMALMIISLTACKIEDKGSKSKFDTWLNEANLEAKETKEQLYKKALKEDTLIIYSTTTRLYKVKESFEKHYEGLTVEIYDTRAHDLVETLLNSYEKESLNCDIVICSDDNTSLTEELLPLNIINKYVPYDIEPFLIEESKGELLYFVGEAEQLFYNSEVYKECPIDNWWELTEEKWENNVYMNSPLRSFPAYALVHSVILNSPKMEEAYIKRYNKALEIPEGKNAGEIFWEKLVENGLKFTTSSNELVEIVGAKGQSKPPMAFMISSKIRRNTIGLNIKAAYGIEPCDGIYSPNSISIAGGAKNINSAKLFVRWILGEKDGKGEGLKPYTLDGTWPVRKDVESQSPISLEEGNFWFNDKTEVAKEEKKVLEFWTKLQKKSGQ